MAFSDIGLLDSLHGLASAAIRKLFGSAGAGVHAIRDAQPSPQPCADPGHRSPPAQAASVAPSVQDLQEINARQRRLAAGFVELKLIRVVPILSVVLEPVSTLLDKYLCLGSRRSEAERRAVSGAPQARAPAVVAAGGELEGKCMSDISKLLFDAAAWRAVHPDARTVANNELAFRLLMRARASTFQLLSHVHNGLQWMLFRLLVDVNVAVEIRTAGAQGRVGHIGCRGVHDEDRHCQH